LEDVDASLKGVTCVFCHTVDEVTGDHNAAVNFADDGVMRGGLPDPIRSTAHKTAYSPLHDRADGRSSDLCGACHDIVTPAGVHLERTYAEWQESLFSDPVAGRQQSCGSCHLPGRDDVVADVDGVPLRRVHDHSMVGVDLALTTFPQRDEQRAAVEASLASTVASMLYVCDTGGGVEITLDLENVAAGHMWPSGAAQDRRAWVELVVTAVDGSVVLSTGVVPEGVAVDAVADEDTWRFGDTLYGSEGEEVHMFWDAHEVTSNLLAPQTTPDVNDPRWIDTHQQRTWYVPSPTPAEVAVKLYLRSVALDTVDDLIASGHLQASLRDEIPTFELTGAAATWVVADGFTCPTL
jgi:hypothetical protein